MGYFNSQSLKIELKPVDFFSLHVILVPDTLTCNYDVMYVAEWLYIYLLNWNVIGYSPFLLSFCSSCTYTHIFNTLFQPF